ncbi:MAG TPA: S8 family serine peptidase, partial [Thermoleophilaceae bacterium]|nr:S8 family serine peptidase [Thermoleophilaceae bacterium]
PGTARLARRFGATLLMPGSGLYRVRLGAARPFAAALRSARLLAFAEPDSRIPRRTAFPSDPRTPDQWWLPAVVDKGLTPPPVTKASPILGIADSQAALRHSELKGHVASTSSGGASDEHGTAVAGVASAADNGTGIVGVWPGMRVIVSVNSLTCSSLVQGVSRARQAGASVINMSYGFPADECFAHLAATNIAFGSGRILVAAGGNDFQNGNTALSPAVDPHILTVAAVNRNRKVAFFSSENNAIDLSAPGVDVLTTVPKAFDDDGPADGFASLDGTSLSSPIVAAAATWIVQRRPQLANDQVVEAMRRSATDLGPPGWERAYGFGLLNLQAALAKSTPAHDPKEPNDDIVWVDGTFFSADSPIWKPGSGTRTLSARIDRLEDPADVYRLRVAAHDKIRLRLEPAFGNPDLEIYKRSADTIYSTKGRLASSSRPAGQAETITWRNGSDKAVTIYADTFVSPKSRLLNAAYRLIAKKP